MDVSILVQIDFADRTIRAIDHFSEIRNAVSYARLNLQLRHGVTLRCLPPDNKKLVILELMVPAEKADNFTVGYHLRGMSRYLLKTHGDEYRSHLVGNRLLQYTVIPKDFDTETNELKMNKYEAVVAFISLLERHDSKAKESTEKIMAILAEN